MTYLIYILVMVATPFVADLILQNMEPDGLLAWWNNKVLFPLKEKNSKWANIAGACPNCFTTWMGTFLGTLVVAVHICMYYSLWWLFLLPTFTFISMGLSAMLFKIYIKLFKDA